jgi:hypothetical protein
MSSNIKIPISRGSEMSFKSLVGQKVTKKVKFMSAEVTISKLTVNDVQDIQAKAKAAENDAEGSGLEVLKTILRSGVEGAEDLSEEDFLKMPMEELTKLSNEVMKFSGFDSEKGK